MYAWIIFASFYGQNNIGVIYYPFNPMCKLDLGC